MQQIIHKLVFSFAAAAVAFALCVAPAQGQTEKIIYAFTGRPGRPSSRRWFDY